MRVYYKPLMNERSSPFLDEHSAGESAVSNGPLLNGNALTPFSLGDYAICKIDYLFVYSFVKKHLIRYTMTCECTVIVGLAVRPSVRSFVRTRKKETLFSQ